MPELAVGHPLHKRWERMKARCHSPTDLSYCDYGGRGITVCDEWRNDFWQYVADIGLPPGPGLTVDRIDNDGNYEPGNVRWATRSQQALNQRKRKRKT